MTIDKKYPVTESLINTKSLGVCLQVHSYIPSTDASANSFLSLPAQAESESSHRVSCQVDAPINSNSWESQWRSAFSPFTGILIYLMGS